MKNMSLNCFKKAIEISIENNVNFILLAGDLFNSSIPSVDNLKEVVKILRLCLYRNIPVYTIAGSHDFSPSGKTIIEVLDKAGLLINVSRGNIVNDKLELDFTVDKLTNVKITGIVGKRGGLEKNIFNNLNREKLEIENNYKIFMFHTAITEIKPAGLEKMDSTSISTLPKQFNYYAGGHVHYVFKKEMKINNGNSLLTYPGPTYPNNFKELEDLKKGTFWIANVEFNNNEYKTNIELIEIPSPEVKCYNIDIDGKSVNEVNNLLFELFDENINNKIITIRIYGQISSGKISEINFKKLISYLYEKGSYFVTINTNKLKSKEFVKYKIHIKDNIDLEKSIIDEHSDNINIDFLNTDNKSALIKTLINSLNTNKIEGEKINNFEERIFDELTNILEIE